MKNLLEKDGRPSAIYMCSKSGWNNEELIVGWLYFVRRVKPEPENPLLLILDSHNTM
jgi:hypothetical protein